MCIKKKTSQELRSYKPLFQAVTWVGFVSPCTLSKF